MAAKNTDPDECVEALVSGLQIWEPGNLKVGNALTQLWGCFNGRLTDWSPGMGRRTRRESQHSTLVLKYLSK